MRVYTLLMTLIAALVSGGALSPTLLHDRFRAYAMAANVIGLAASALMLFHGKVLLPRDRRDTGRRANTADRSSKGAVMPSAPGPMLRVQTAHADGEDKHADADADADGGVAGLLFDFYTGIQFNPRIGPLDLKVGKGKGARAWMNVCVCVCCVSVFVSMLPMLLQSLPARCH